MLSKKHPPGKMALDVKDISHEEGTNLYPVILARDSKTATQLVDIPLGLYTAM